MLVAKPKAAPLNPRSVFMVRAAVPMLTRSRKAAVYMSSTRGTRRQVTLRSARRGTASMVAGASAPFAIAHSLSVKEVSRTSVDGLQRDTSLSPEGRRRLLL